MNHLTREIALILCLAAGVAAGRAADGQSEPAHGWRGNGTGLWPEASPPLEWSRLPRGATDGLRAAGSRPADGKPDAAPLVEKGLIREWLLLGPFVVKDSVAEFDRDLLDGEANVEPAPGQETAGLVWTPLTGPPDDVTVFGAPEPPFVDLAKSIGFQPNRIAYVHAALFSPRGGPVRVVVDHSFGLKAWINGQELLSEPQRDVVLGTYPAISTQELRHLADRSPRFDATLRPGWNRLLLKVSTSPREDFKEMRFALRISDPPDVPYESKNIVWMAPLPARSTSTPLLVAERLFVMCEPDELLCLEKQTGRVLWSAFINGYEALEPETKKANPAYAARVDPLVANLQAETDRRQRIKLRGEIQKTLEEIDAERFRMVTDGHFAGHFGIVGFTMPTPVTDGRHIFVWNGMGVAACFDLDGTRKWITRLPAKELGYGSSPALADGVLAVFQHGLYGLDAGTGQVRWKQERLSNNIGAMQAATFGGQQVFVAQRGDVLRPSDGEFLFRPRGSAAPGDIGWAPPQILGNRVYLPKYGVANLRIYDFSDVKDDAWEPKQLADIALPREATQQVGGRWRDRWSAGSPLVWNDIAYVADIYQTLYAIDLPAKKMLYRQEMDLHGFSHYNSIAIAASPTLVGKHIFVMDNQGTTLVLEPGPVYKVVARNQIATQLDRDWPIPAQETLSYAPPLADGNRLYLRGEAYLYCIGEK